VIVYTDIVVGEFHSAEVAMDIHDLEAITAQRKRTRNKLEKAIAKCWATQNRPVAWKRRSRLTENHNPVAQNTVAQVLGYEVVDAIEYYSRELGVLNERVANLQATHFEQRQKVDEVHQLRLAQIQQQLEDRTRAALYNVGSRFAHLIHKEEGYGPAGEDLGTEEETLSQMKDKRRNSLVSSLLRSLLPTAASLRPLRLVFNFSLLIVCHGLPVKVHLKWTRGDRRLVFHRKSYTWVGMITVTCLKYWRNLGFTSSRSKLCRYFWR
jgi:hypothetical protein